MVTGRAILYAACLAAAPASAQMLRVEAAAVERGGTAVVPIVFDAAGAHPVAALEFTLAVPAGKGVEPRMPAASSGARGAGKSIACSGAWKKPGSTYRWTCILAGGASAIPPGAVASASFAVSSGARPGEHDLQLEKAKGTDANARPAEVKVQSAKLTVR